MFDRLPRCLRRTRSVAFPIALLAGVSASGLGGCAAMNDLYRADDVVKAPRGKFDGLPHERIEAIDLTNRPYCDLYKRAQGDSRVNCSGRDTTQPILDVPATMPAVDARNLLQSMLIARSERICQTHKGAIVSYSAGANLTLGLTSAALGTAGALVTGGASNILAGLAAIAATGRASVQEDVFHKILAPAVVKQINEDRKNFYNESIVPRRGKSIAEYNTADAVTDVLRYHDKCSFYSGLSSLADTAGRTPTRAQALNAEMLELQGQVEKSDARAKAIAEQLKSDKLQALEATTRNQTVAALQRQLAAEYATQLSLRQRIRALTALVTGVVP